MPYREKKCNKNISSESVVSFEYITFCDMKGRNMWSKTIVLQSMKSHVSPYDFRFMHTALLCILHIIYSLIYSIMSYNIFKFQRAQCCCFDIIQLSLLQFSKGLAITAKHAKVLSAIFKCFYCWRSRMHRTHPLIKKIKKKPKRAQVRRYVQLYMYTWIRHHQGKLSRNAL